MPSFPWLPLDTVVNEFDRSNKVFSEGDHYQILNSKNADKTILLIKDYAPWLSKVGNGVTYQFI